MSIKTKVTLGVVFLFAVILTIGGQSLYYLTRLSNESKNILIDNYESLEYTKRIIEGCDSLIYDSVHVMLTIESNLELQEANITESGERELTHQLRVNVERLKNESRHEVTMLQLRTLCLELQALNMSAIKRKNEITQKTARNASTYLIIIVTCCTLAAFTFIVNFPGYVANPIIQLTKGIKSIAEKNYNERLSFDRKDEFEELAEAFNQMAEKLDEYEHSNLAKILFEKKRIEIIINKMTDPVIGLDEFNKVIFTNDKAADILNLDRSNIIDKYAPDVALNNDLFRNLIRQNDNGNSLIKAVVDGRENYFSKETVWINYVPTGEKEKVNIGAVILLKNVTTYKELDLAKTNFMATISHELKTPIASLQMCVSLLQDSRVGDLNSEQQNIAHTLREEVDRISNITNELLDLSQVETGNIKLNIGTCSAQDIISLAAEAVKFQSERKHVSIRFDVKQEGAFVQADIDKTTWVLVNFLTNAIRYSPENGEIDVRCTVINKRVNFSVIDKGPGIEEKYLKRIFEKFFQIPGTPAGTGLGLAIAKEFIEAQGGEIHVISKVGSGSVFSFDLLKS